MHVQWSDVTDDLLGQAKRPFAEFMCSTSTRNISLKFDWCLPFGLSLRFTSPATWHCGFTTTFVLQYCNQVRKLTTCTGLYETAADRNAPAPVWHAR